MARLSGKISLRLVRGVLWKGVGALTIVRHTEYLRPDQDRAWSITSLVSLALFFFLALAYFVWERMCFNRRHPMDTPVADDADVAVEEDAIVSNLNFTRGQRECARGSV